MSGLLKLGQAVWGAATKIMEKATMAKKIPMTVMFLAVLLLAVFVAPTKASTVPTFTLNFDEMGNATLSINGGATSTLTGALVSNPKNVGIAGGMALTFMFPTGITVGNGDVVVSEGTGLPASDAIRFTDALGNLTGNTADRMIFYSDQDDLPLLLADTGLPSNLGTGTSVTVTETALPGGGNGFTYSSAVTPGGLSDVYNGISDPSPVPEPTSLFLFGTGLLGIVGYGRKKWLR
jgi:hypothetical protein